MTDNAGATDDHRTLNYLAMRYPGIYAKTAEEFARDFSLTGVDVLPLPLSGTRKLVDVILSYTNRNTDFTEKFFVRVDVTEEFPFLVTKMSPLLRPLNLTNRKETGNEHPEYAWIYRRGGFAPHNKNILHIFH